MIADGLKGELSPVEEVGVEAVLGTPPDAGLWRSSSRAGDGGGLSLAVELTKMERRKSRSRGGRQQGSRPIDIRRLRLPTDNN